MNELTEQILKRAQKGDREAFSRLLNIHYDRLLHFAYKFSGNQQDAEDITQQTCVKLAHSLDQFRHESSFTTWLYRIALNCALDWQRRGKREQPIEEAAMTSLSEPTTQSAESSLFLEQVLARVEQMGDDFRATLVLVHGEGMSHAEAAQLLGVKESTVSWRIHEIRKRLKVEMPQGEIQ